MKKRLEFNILTIASPKMGLGHLKRCVLLAKEIQKKNKLNFYIFSKKKFLEKTKNIHKINIILNPRKIKKSDITIVDMYQYNDKFYKKLYKTNHKILIFDDNKYIVPNFVSGIINTNIYADISKYDYGTKVFSGKKYSLIDQKFFKPTNIINSNENIFICVGGSDPTNQMNNLITLALKKSDRDIYAIFGHLHNNQIEKKWIDNKRVKILFGINNIKKYMLKSKFAITSAGTLLYELYLLKIPAIFISLDTNQESVANFFSKKQGYSSAGNLNNLDINNLEKLIYFFDKKKIKLKNNELDKYTNGPKNLFKDINDWATNIDDININTYPKDLVRKEYDNSSTLKHDHEKLHWGSRKSMINRYNLISNEINFNLYSKWLDIGSGIGLLQTFINKKFPNIKISGTGLEISKKLYKISLNNKIQNIRFKNLDFGSFKEKNYDIITCFGVLSKTNVNFETFLKINSKILKNNGELFFDIKNIEWNDFTKKKKFPDPRHSWFKISQIIKFINRQRNLDILEIFGFLPMKNLKVLPNKSHNVFVRLKKVKPK